MKLYLCIQKTFAQIEELFDEEALQSFINSDTSVRYLYHFSLGTWIRNNLLGTDTALYQEFVLNGLTDKDDMSAIIIDAFLAYQKNKPIS